MFKTNRVKATMADVFINRRTTESGRRKQGQGSTMECERDKARPGPVPSLPLILREILTASPSELLQRFMKGMDRLFEGTSISPMTVWSPSIAISKMDEHLTVRAELPGLNAHDVKVELTRDGLTISGQRSREPDDWHDSMYWSARFCRSFIRTIPIPDEAQVEEATATFEDEILTVLVPLSNHGPSHGRSTSPA